VSNAAAAPAPTDPTRTDPIPAQGPDWTAAIAQIRSAAAWIVKAFAAVAVALVGTSPLLVNLGNLGLNARSAVAIAGAVLALVAIGVIISAATDINLTQLTDIVDLINPTDDATKEFIRRIEGSPAAQDLYLGGARSVSDLLARRRTLQADYRTLLLAVGRMKTPAGVATAKALADETLANMTRSDTAVQRLLRSLTYRRIRTRFDDRRPRFFVAGSLAVLGIVVWLTALGIDISGSSNSSATSASSSGTLATAQGTVGTLTWVGTESGARAAASLREQLGLSAATCDQATVLVTGGTGDPTDPWQVSILPNQLCKAPEALGIFTVDRRLAVYSALDPTAGPKATVTVKSDSTLPTSDWVVITICAAAVAAGVTAVTRWHVRQRPPRSPSL
jgi:hypothetical protein